MLNGIGASFTEYYYGLQREFKSSGQSWLTTVIGVIALAIGPFINDMLSETNGALRIIRSTVDLGWTVGFATGWVASPTPLLRSLGVEYSYREDPPITSIKELFKPSLSMIIYALRLVQYLSEQDAKTVELVRAPQPMPVAEPKQGMSKSSKACPVCKWTFAFDGGRELVSLPSGHVLCKTCLPSPDSEGRVECPVSGIRVLKKYIRQLHF